MIRSITRSIPVVFLLLMFSAVPVSSWAAADWSSIDQLETDGKFADIPERLDAIIQQAEQQQHHKDWRDALLLRASLTFSDDEAASIDQLSTAKWPQDQDSQLLLHLYLAAFTQRYLERDSWDINRRETIESDKPLRSKQKTMAQLRADVHAGFSKAYQLSLQRNDPIRALNRLPLTRLKGYFREGDYPENVRGSVRDTVTYLWVDALKNTGLWAPGQMLEAVGFNLQSLLDSPLKEVDPTDVRMHPLKVAIKLLNDLEQFNQANQKPEAALEAFRLKIGALHKVRNGVGDLPILINALKLKIRQQESNGRALPWTNRLRLTMAFLLDQTDSATKHIQRLAVLKPCLAESAESRLYKLCKGVSDNITQPVFHMPAMQSDGLNKRSLQLQYKNLEQVHFRAWKLTPAQAIQGNSKRQELLSQWLKQGNVAQYQWQIPLAKTKDYRTHSHFVTPPMKQKGYWLIAASNDQAFGEQAHIVWTEMSITSLAADIRYEGHDLNVTSYLGESGHIAANIEVELWQFDYSQPDQARRVAAKRSGSDGQVTFSRKEGQAYRLIMRHRDDYNVIHQLNPGYPRYRNDAVDKNALIFTDRAIYRPSQAIQWKVVAYQGNASKGRYQVFPNTDGWVKLVDANGKLVKQVPVKTNSFGSASGEFSAEPGRLLGDWRIETSWGGYQGLSVEEYKRPTFEAKFLSPKQSLRLNHLVSVTGIARYYFGDVVSSGSVRWRVERSAMSVGVNYIKGETVASGNAELNQKGEFIVRFTPQMPHIPKHPDTLQQVYRYQVSADITDSGGETRSVSRTFSVADVNVRATINNEDRFTIAGQPLSLTVNRLDMDGEGLSGSGFWELYRLEQPAQAIMPADLPAAVIPKAEQPYATPGDRLRPRWANEKGLETRSKRWRAGARVAQGALKHQADGQANITLKAPAAGVYRLKYTTKDQWGQVYRKQQAVVISDHHTAPVTVPALLKVQQSSVEVGQQVSLLAGSAYANAPVLLEVFHGKQLLRRSLQRGGIKKQQFAVMPEHRGGLTFVLTLVKDFQLIRLQERVNVPWTDRNLNVSFSTFRDKLRPGQKETWRVTVKDHKDRPMETGAVEVLSAMFDRSLELLKKHQIAGVAGLYPRRYAYLNRQSSLGIGQSLRLHSLPGIDGGKPYWSTNFALLRSFSRELEYDAASPSMSPIPIAARMAAPVAKTTAMAGFGDAADEVSTDTPSTDLDGIVPRTNFNETAFFKPHLVLEKNGSVSFEFEVPESLTQWQVWVSALTRDLRGGSAKAFSRTSKELMVRPYLPRFLRAGDKANIEVLINNSSDKAMTGIMSFDVIDPATENSLAGNFKLSPTPRRFKVAAGQSSRQRYTLTVPKELGMVTIRAKASADNGTQNYGDGEQRPLPILPSRVHLSQSRFAALQGNTQRQLRFNELASDTDPTRINDKLVVTVDGQLFYSALKAVPYLTDYPYECTEQTLNRFLSTSIINNTFAQTPSLKAMASEFAKRKTQLENWSSIEADPNSSMLLEETPWLRQAKGGSDDDTRLLKVLDPKVAAAQAKQSIQKLVKAQTRAGGFPWWEGGPASPYMTAYLLQGFAKAAEFNVEVPKNTVQRAWRYLYQYYLDELKPTLDASDNSQFFIALNYTLSAFPDASWYSDTFTHTERTQMLDQSMKQWQTLPPLLKAQLALTLKRMGRVAQANRVFESVMNAAKSDADNGVYWPQQNRSWLWYNDRIDTHAFMLRAMMEIKPQDARRHGLVQWLMLNKKLNHWKSTRATAESVYALVHYLKREQQLGVDERMLVKVGHLPEQSFVFKANEYRGGKQQMMLKDRDITPDMANILLKNDSKPLMFASATWHFSTDQPPASAQGDFFGVTHRFFKRVKQGTEWRLQPLAEGATISVGDQLEVQLSLSSKHHAEYVHLRAPRGAGFEPMENRSGYRWQNGVGYYQEVRDSGANYFFDRLPAGKYDFKYRLRATTSGQFNVAPATVQSVYAPEFNAYSRGTRLSIQ